MIMICNHHKVNVIRFERNDAYVRCMRYISVLMYIIIFFFFQVWLVEENKEELHRIFHFIFLGNALFDQKLIFLGNALFEFDQKIGSFLKVVLHWDTIIKGRSSFLAFLTLPRNLCQESGKLLTIPLKFMCLVLNSTAYYEQRRNKRCFWFS